MQRNARQLAVPGHVMMDIGQVFAGSRPPLVCSRVLSDCSITLGHQHGGDAK